MIHASRFLFVPLALGTSMRAQAPRYTLTDVTPAQADFAVECSLNDRGQMCGLAYLPAPITGFSYLWTPGQRGRPSGWTFLSDPSWIADLSLDLNDAGTVVGMFGNNPAITFVYEFGYRWSGGSAAELRAPDGSSCWPSAINDAGWIAGLSRNQPAGGGAVVWDPNLVPSWVAGMNEAVDINASGAVVGYLHEGAFPGIARGYHSASGVVTPLGTLDPADVGDVLPRAINDAGVVVGWNEIGIGPRQRQVAFRWTASGGIEELSGLGVSGAAAALDVNASGWIVGYAAGSTGRTGVLWSPDGTPTELRPRLDSHSGDWVRIGLWKLNARGVIAGSGGRPGVGGHSLLFTPAWLTLAAPLPPVVGGLHTVSVNGLTPGKRVFLAGDDSDPDEHGYYLLPGGGGIGLGMARPHVVASALADAFGQATLTWSVTPALAGRSIRLQACEVSESKVSNPLRFDL